MSGETIEDIKKQEPSDNLQVEGNKEDQKDTDANSENPMPSSQQEEEIIRKKYGGIIPKKPPLISMDHERAYFDSADWALGKQGAQKPKGPLEALRPKLQPTPHNQARSRRSAYAPADNDEDDGIEQCPHEDESKNKQDTSEDQSLASDNDKSKDTAAKDH